jgi:CTP synthase (UTP-ammonia lyase)
MNGALNAIRFAREQGVPFLGTCAGFQHVLIEYARNVIGLTDADHEEIRPDAACLLVCRLSSPMVEREGRVTLQSGSRLQKLYGGNSALEVYHCNFGLSRSFESVLDDGHLRFSARDALGGVHAVELKEQPFFVATLFQPERAGLRSRTHPIVRAFVAAALARR